MGIRVGTVAVAAMYAGLAYYCRAAYVEDVVKTSLLCMGLWTGLQSLEYHHVAMLLSMLHLMSTQTPLDSFANCGHITLLVASGQTTLFYLASLVAMVHIVAYAPEAPRFILMATSLLYFFTTRSPSKLYSRQPWRDCTLLHLHAGAFGVFLSYVVALVVYGAVHVCAPGDALVYYIHVGGIFAFVVYIFPQVHPDAFVFVRYIIVGAAMGDVLFCIMQVWAGTGNWITLFRGVCAMAVVPAIYTLVPNYKSILVPSEPASVQWEGHQMLLCGCYACLHVAIPFLYGMNAADSLGYQAHMVFLITGLAMTSIMYKDELLRRVTLTLIFFSGLGIAVSEFVFDHDAYHILQLLSFAMIWYSLPSDATYQVGFLTFYPETL
jgi:hypothetical protein